MQPIIGITADMDEKRFFLNRAYAAAIELCGAVPLVLSAGRHIHSALDFVGGLLLSGGGDIDARFFDQETHEKAADIYPERDKAEIQLARLAFMRDIPIFGICRGMQILNIALGGDLIQHIDGHKQNEPRNEATHAIRLSGKLEELTGRSEIMVNTIHHQVVGKVATGLEVNAMSEDGYAEALWAKGKAFVLAVQWHPEELIHQPEHLKLFEEFVRAAKVRHK